MNLYLVVRTDDFTGQYDIVEAFVCAANSPEEAIATPPFASGKLHEDEYVIEWPVKQGWLKATEIGKACSDKPGIVLLSYHHA